MVLLTMPLPYFYHKTEEYIDQDCSFKRKTTKLDRKLEELKYLIKEKEERVVLNKGPAFYIKQKKSIEEAKPKGPAVSFERTLCQTNMWDLVLVFAILFQRKGMPNFFEKDFCSPSPIKKRRPKKQRLRVLQFFIEETIGKH